MTGQGGRLESNVTKIVTAGYYDYGNYEGTFLPQQPQVQPQQSQPQMQQTLYSGSIINIFVPERWWKNTLCQGNNQNVRRHWQPQDPVLCLGIDLRTVITGTLVSEIACHTSLGGVRLWVRALMTTFTPHTKVA